MGFLSFRDFAPLIVVYTTFRNYKAVRYTTESTIRFSRLQFDLVCLLLASVALRSRSRCMADEWPNLVWCSVDGIIDNREKDQEVQSKST